ncbi:MAG: alpha/beta hydrolase [Bacteroidales bacterium]|nr:alpha/beta hydrolase [Bacteroidales bacterium]
MTRYIFLFLFVFTTSLVYGQNEKINYGNNPANGGCKRINGINLYYEIYGSGKPLVLLHGSGGSIIGQTDRIEYFKKYFKVIAIDSRAHGKSIDTSNNSLTYVQMAYDVKVLLDSLQIDSAYVWGQSDGGILGLLLAINYPNKLAKLATFGANIFPGNKAVFDEINKMVIDSLKITKDIHTKRLYSLLAYQPHITEKQLSEIKCPVLIMTGDRDAIRLEHSIKIFNNIPNSNLFVMPGATHYGSYQKPDLFNAVLIDFLNSPFSKLSTVDILSGKL